MRTHEILALAMLALIIGWIGFMAMNSASASGTPPAGSYETNTTAASTVKSDQIDSVGADIGNPRAGETAPDTAPTTQGSTPPTQTIQIKVVNGYYAPREIRVKAGTHLRLNLDPATMVGCMREFNVWGLNQRMIVSPTNHVLEFDASTPGTYRTSCGMGMGDGRLIIEAASG